MAAGRLGAEIKQLQRCSGGAFELPTPVLLQSLAGGKSFNFFVSGRKSTRLNHCPVSSKLGIRNNSALGPFFKKLPGNWVLNSFTDGLKRADAQPGQAFTFPKKQAW